MDYSEYMMAAYYNNFKEVKMTEGDLSFLTEQVITSDSKEGPFSAYKIYSKIKKEGSSLAYKNVHQKVHKLLSLGLIEEVETGYILHGAKYYQISPNGWLNLILKSEDPYLQAVKKYYDKNIIFKTFVYPYFELETIMYFLNYLELNAYLRNCCQTTVRIMNQWESGGQKLHGICGLPREKLRALPEEELLNALKYKLDVKTSYQDDQVYTLAGLRKMIKSHRISAMSFFTPKTITETLDLHVKSFLLGQIIKSSHIPFVRSALSEDRKFMAAVVEIEEEFHGSYDKLKDLCNNDN
jgi:hypothetical protein